MNDALERLAREIRLDNPERRPLRYAFGLACAQRVRHLLEDPLAPALLDGLSRFVNGGADEAELQAAATQAAQLANRHPGSQSIDGASHAAVSATYAVANALAGDALAAAGYAAYAVVYSYGGYAVSDRAAFEPEFTWQIEELERLSEGLLR